MNHRELEQLKVHYLSHLNTDILITYTSAQLVNFAAICKSLKNQLMANVFVVLPASQGIAYE